MQLTFLGKSYSTSMVGSPAQETGEIGTFLGKHYAIKEGQKIHRQPATNLTYRGVHYRR